MNYNLKSDLRNPLAIGSSVTARVKAEVSITSSTTPQKVSQLSIPVEAGATYLVEAWLPFTLVGDASGYTFSVAGPTTSSVLLRRMVINGVDKTIDQYSQSAALNAVSNSLASSGHHELQIVGQVKFSAAGEFHVLFAQFVSDSEEITLKVGGYLKLTRVN